MRISELSEHSGVSVASIKYYRREGLLPAGHATASNQATYDEHHVHRLRLIRALIEIGGLAIANVRAVLDAVDSGTTTLHDAFGSVMHALDPNPMPRDDPELDLQEAAVRRWLKARQWGVKAEAPAIRQLAGALLTLNQFEFAITLDSLEQVALEAERVAEVEVAIARQQSDRTASVETMLVGTVVYGQVLTEIRRLALEAVSARTDRAAKSHRGRGK